MPTLKARDIAYIFTGFLILLSPSTIRPAQAWEGIDTYYVRYDIKFSSSKAAGEELTMVPANSEPVEENFSLFSISNLILAPPHASRQSIEKLAKKNALKQIVEKNGLRSVKTLNHKTIVTYEGMVLTPLDIRISGYDEKNGGYAYSANVRFAPIAFPDKWEKIKKKKKMKDLLNDFFLFFK